MKPSHLIAGLLAMTVAAQPVLAATTLSSNERNRVARAAPRDREALRSCLIERKKAQKKGTVIGAAGAGAGTAIAGGDLGGSLLGAGIGALAGNQIGKEAGTSKRCHSILERNR
jgi:outer membrane lipoprotein SlyB